MGGRGGGAVGWLGRANTAAGAKGLPHRKKEKRKKQKQKKFGENEAPTLPRTKFGGADSATHFVAVPTMISKIVVVTTLATWNRFIFVFASADFNFTIINNKSRF